MKDLPAVLRAATFIAALIGLIYWPNIRGWWRRRGVIHAEAEVLARYVDADAWLEFVKAHPLDDGCPDCSLWDAKGDRPVITPCQRHKEQAP